MDIELLRERARIIAMVRSFFIKKQYIETDTPLLAPDLIPESCLEVFETQRLWPQGSKNQPQAYWLIPSPEVWMKRLIAKHRHSMFQICKCFRNSESTGHLHSPEFTMLEYYTMNANYMDSLEITEELFSFLLLEPLPFLNSVLDIKPPFEKISMDKAFIKLAGFSLLEAAETKGGLEKEARRLGLDPMPGLGIAELYDLIFIHAIEPSLPKQRPVVLMDYPAFVPCLARKSPNNKTVERWELYLKGIELANCFSEETCAQEVKRFFETEKAEKQKHALVQHKVDEDYWKLFNCREESGTENGEEYSGVAMGLDRLIMALCGRSTIDSVLPFPV